MRFATSKDKALTTRWFVKNGCGKLNIPDSREETRRMFTPHPPMLAKMYSQCKFSEPVYSQPKLDGVRCVADTTGLWTRSGRRITCCGHIEEALASFFIAHPGKILDGELYHQSLAFSEIISQVNRRSPGDTLANTRSEKVELHIFDSVVPNQSFSERWNRLSSLLVPFITGSTSLRLVPTHHVHSQYQLDEFFARYLASGYEGQMIRLDLPYECRRSAALLKRKLFEDDEFLIERVDAGSSAGRAYVKRVVLKTATGRRFAANVAGGQAVEEQLLTRSLHSATVKFQGLTSAQVPRFPIATAFHSLPRDL
jgi:DNA ligase-1